MRLGEREGGREGESEGGRETRALIHFRRRGWYPITRATNKPIKHKMNELDNNFFPDKKKHKKS